MSEPIFVSLEEVHEIHAAVLLEAGGASGVRDLSGLESAVMQPQQHFYYVGGDLFELAAAYAFHIAEAQAYLDGNKRVAIATAIVFLKINGVRTYTATEQLHAAMIEIAERKLDKRGLASVFRSLYLPRA